MPIGGSKRRALGREPEKSVGWECFSLFLSLLPALGYFDTRTGPAYWRPCLVLTAVACARSPRRRVAKSWRPSWQSARKSS
jgi:hypothetical protein